MGLLVVMSDLLFIFINNFIPEARTPLPSSSCIPSLAVGVEVPCNGSAALQDDSPLVQLVVPVAHLTCHIVGL